MAWPAVVGAALGLAVTLAASFAVTIAILGLRLWRLRKQLRGLRQSEARLALALEASDAALWEWHIAEQRMVLSDRYFEQLGYPPGYHQPTTEEWRALVHPDDWERAVEVVRANLRSGRQGGGGVYVNEYRMRDASGRWRWMLARGRVTQRDAAGRPIVMVGTHIDIDAMKQQQALALASHERFQKIYAASPDSMGINRISDGVYIDVNPRFLAQTGYAREEVLGRTSTELGLWVEPEQRARLIELFERDGRVDSLEMCARSRDGVVVNGLISVRLLIEQGERCMLFIFRDITERERLRREAEQARRERIEAEAASRAKTEFLSRMSHELRTPLNAVLGFAQLLQVSPSLARRDRDQADAIGQAGWHLLNLIDDVLDIAGIEAGQLRLRLEPVPLAALLAEALELVSPQALAAAVTLRSERAGAGLDTLLVEGDPQRLRQSLVNLLGNAIKYNHRGGEVHVEAGRDGERVLLCIRDTGIGMSADQLAHLFEPFNRLGRERDGNVEGTGIGLVLTKHLLELMGAGLAIDSEPGRGTTARVSLRAAAPAAAAPVAVVADAEEMPAAAVSVVPDAEDMPAAAVAVVPDAEDMPAAAVAVVPDAEDMPAARLLYIEDNPVNQTLVGEVLAPWPQLELALADDGRAGLRMAAELRPALILLDMRLPDMDGLEVMRALRADAALAAIPVVVLSADAMAHEVEAACAAGALAYWTKPLRLDRFVDDLKATLKAVRDR